MQVTIRPLQEKDAYTSVHWRNDPEVFKYTGSTYDHEITIESELNWIRKVINNPNDFRCAIIADDIYVGNVYLTDIEVSSAHFHIFIGNKAYWGKGVALLASELILNHAFDELLLQRVLLRVHKNNIAAIKLYKRLGFQEILSDDNWISMMISKDVFTVKTSNCNG